MDRKFLISRNPTASQPIWAKLRANRLANVQTEMAQTGEACGAPFYSNALFWPQALLLLLLPAFFPCSRECKPVVARADREMDGFYTKRFLVR